MVSGQTDPSFVTVTNAQGASITLAPFGARLVVVRMPDRNGLLGSCVLGFDALDDYITYVDTYMGTTIGRVAGRSAGARFVGGGLDLTLEPNDNGHTLHSGPNGSLDRVTWTAESVADERGVGVRFTFLSEDGSGGYPGNLEVQSTYLLSDDNVVTFDMRAVSDRDTPVALTQHAYWNLSSGGSATVVDDLLRIDSHRRFGMTPELVATGDMVDITDTGFDFRVLRSFRERLPEATGVPWPGLDHTFELRQAEHLPANSKAALGGAWHERPAATLASPSTGRRMDIFTTQPALQVYLGCHLGNVAGRDGAVYGPGHGVCLETVRFPDSPLLPNLPTIVLPAGDEYQHHTVHQFTTD
jgi:aldose 1-epimerase